MSASDGMIWVLAAGAFVLGAAAALTVAWLAGWRRPTPPPPAPVPDIAPAESPADPRTGPPPDSAASAALPQAVQALILTVAAERAQCRSSVLVLSPPASPSSMTWHVHLDPVVALDVRDGRTIPLPATAPTHRWTLPGGQSVQVATGGPERPASGETVGMRVECAYVRVTLAAEGDRWRTLTATVFGDPRSPSDLRADLVSWSAVEAAINQALDLALGGRARGPAPALGYGRAAWDSHQRTWLFPPGS